MNSNVNTNRPNDIPASLALMILAGVLFVLWIAHHGSLRTFNVQEADKFLHRNSFILILGGLATLLNVGWIAAVLKSAFGFQKQGTRLQRLMGKPQARRLPSRDEIVLFVVFGGVAYLLLHFWAKATLIGPGLYFTPVTLLKVSIFFQMNIALLSAFLIFVLRRLPLPWHAKKNEHALPPFPNATNAIVLGSTNEATEDEVLDDLSENPRWVLLNRKALNGNILITGSIGGGKSQGTILPYFDQILRNFSPSPTILAIDPKGTFLEEAAALIRARGLTDKLLRIELEGKVTFNPIYEPNALHSGRFVSIARMIRAAAANFMGRTLDDQFWEESAYNLVKNSLAYCAAMKDYYTLNDLYNAILRANENKIAPDLDTILAAKAFTTDEEFNLRQAREYFSGEFAALESRVRTSILATSTSFLNQFRDSKASAIFCPPQDKLTLPSLDHAIDQGAIILFGIIDPGLARSMGTFVKLHYEQSLLNRLNDDSRPRKRTGVLIIDEYQDVVTTASGALIGDNSFLAKGREANTLSIMATQSLTSLFNAVGKEASAQELIQNFRTRIASHSFDLKTIQAFQELVGKKEFERTSRSVSELSQNPKLNLVHGGFESAQANLSESVNVSEYRDYAVTGKDFSTLPTFECFAHVYDGVRTQFMKLFLKPHYLKDKTAPHYEILRDLAKGTLAALLAFTFHLPTSFGFPNVCTALATNQTDSCIDLNVSTCTCGWPVPRPCAHFSYYLPQTFVETFPDRGSSFFSDLPGTALQLASSTSAIPYGSESDLETHSFQSHTVSVPFLPIVEELLPCGGSSIDKFCFDGMSEHLGSLWTTGSADSLQPNFLAGGLSPAACMTVGAVSSIAGNINEPPQPGAPTCSFDHSWMLKFPPSGHQPCNGWGVFFPRSGSVTGPSQTVGALMVAARMKSLSTDVFQATPRSSGEKWEMLSPQSSSCFREGENIASLETLKSVREERRLVSRKFKGHLFVVWKKYSCCRDLAEVPVAYTTLETVKASCAGIGNL